MKIQHKDIVLDINVSKSVGGVEYVQDYDLQVIRGQAPAYKPTRNRAFESTAGNVKENVRALSELLS